MRYGPSSGASAVADRRSRSPSSGAWSSRYAVAASRSPETQAAIFQNMSGIRTPRYTGSSSENTGPVNTVMRRSPRSALSST
ncbi:hypothetical protein BC477_00245 [Clavibacter michiganensis subsp. michiganensis]|uniref:Uncharacterized protein n=1 Tax=Clavibacter michiganensis subsp. michiganensis TaxID=33013 RepID=A0A251XFB9_CLAMM|nr:hypothetical protein BC477_00245 [Clavibacter michiganensis subsp. michiganensis]OUE00996.1 hypothetical protein CMMCAS07_16270 [Clavibacter michiganensis subsp. michiganensis]